MSTEFVEVRVVCSDGIPAPALDGHHQPTGRNPSLVLAGPVGECTVQETRDTVRARVVPAEPKGLGTRLNPIGSFALDDEFRLAITDGPDAGRVELAVSFGTGGQTDATLSL